MNKLMLLSITFARRLMLILVISMNLYAQEEAAIENNEAIDPGLSEAASSDMPSGLERVGGLNEEQLRQLALSEEVKEHEVVWLEVSYPEDETVHQVLALEQKPRSPKGRAQGAIILLHDKEQHADWPFLIRTLRLVLPDSGWYTIAVNLPYDDLRNIPERELGPKELDEIEMTDSMRIKLMEASARIMKPKEDMESDGSDQTGDEASENSELARSEPAEESASDEEESVDIDLAESKPKVLPYRERAQYHLKAAVERASQKGYRNVIIVGYRAGADIALDYVKPLASQVRKQGFGLVMIDPKLQIGYQRDLSSALGQNFRAPVLDVVNGSDLDGRVEAAEREAGARIANSNLYRQIRLSANESGAFQQTLVRRVRSWLEKYAPGMSARQLQGQNF